MSASGARSGPHSGEFTLYLRSTCSLCEAMEQELAVYVERYGMTIKRCYIDNDASLEQEYGTRVPVLERDGETICQYFLDEKALEILCEQGPGS